MRGLSLVAASGGHSSSRCVGLSLSRPLLLRSTGSRRAGSVIVAHGPSCSAACGFLPDQGSNPCPLHWQADSQPLRHQGSPPPEILHIQMNVELLKEPPLEGIVLGLTMSFCSKCFWSTFFRTTFPGVDQALECPQWSKPYVLGECGAFAQEKMLSHSGDVCVWWWGGSVSVVRVEQVWNLEWDVSGSVPLSSSYKLGQAAQRLRAPNSLCAKWKKSHLPCGVVVKIKCINVCRVLVPGKHSKSVNTLLDYTVLLTHFVSSQMKLLCSSTFKPSLSLLMFFPIPPPTYISPSCISVCPNPVSL